VGDHESFQADVFIWSTERSKLTLAREGDSWKLIQLAEGPLLGPKHVVYEARHRRATLAAWDVLSRVRITTHDPEEGVRVAESAARWMRSQLGA
jgi:hypothetical protein